MFARGYRFADVYPGLNSPGTNPTEQSYTNAASSPGMAINATSPAMILIAIVVVLVAIRLIWENAPVRSA
jgi:hypothetical protein